MDAVSLEDMETRLSGYTDTRLTPVESGQRFLVGPPTGVAATDTAAVQAQITAAAAAGGGTVQLQSGRYLINASLSIASFVTLQGVGSGARAAEYGINPSTASSELGIASGATVPLIVNSDTSGGNTAIVIRDLRLSMAGCSTGVSDPVAIKFNKVRRAVITSIYILGEATTTRRGIHILGASERILITDDVFLEGCGIYCTGSSAITIRDIEIGAGGILLEDAYYAMVRGCQVYNDGTAEGVNYPTWVNGIRLYRCHDGIVADNSVVAFSHDGIELNSSASCIVRSNICNDNSRATSNTWGGILLETGDGGTNCQNNLVQGNRCYNRLGTTQKCGLRITQSVGSTTLNTVVYNDFRNNQTEGVTTNAIKGNRVEHNPGQPIETVASATALGLPSSGPLVIVSGTTTITSVTAVEAGREVTLRFSGALTFTDGSNLILAGNFVTTADDTITLLCDGTNWIEKCRSVN